MFPNMFTAIIENSHNIVSCAINPLASLFLLSAAVAELITITPLYVCVCLLATG